MDTLLRYFDMLCLIPKAPKSITAKEITEKLADTGYVVDLRTIQRDLIKLSGSHLFPISSTENTKPIRWFWGTHLNPMQFPLMSVDEALTLKLTEMFLEPLLPPAVRSRLSGYFQLASNRLQESKFDSWADKVRVLPNNLTLAPAEIEPTVLAVIYDAVLNNLRFSGIYQPVYSPQKNYNFNPLGLVFRGNLIYLVATLNDYTDIKQFALHRFKSAELSDRIVKVPDGFSLDNYIEKGEFDLLLNDEQIHLKAKIGEFLKQILSETPLAPEQRISEMDGEHFLLEATVKDTGQLRWWMKSFGTEIEVLEPLDLRAEFAEEALQLVEMYVN